MEWPNAGLGIKQLAINPHKTYHLLNKQYIAWLLSSNESILVNDQCDKGRR